MRRVLLDTNAYSALMRGDEALLGVLAEAEVVYLSVFVLGELYVGFKGGRHERQNRETLRDFRAAPTAMTLLATEETAEVFGAVKDALKKKGTPLPLNDVWIAAHALETGATLLTYDDHFEAVEGLRRWPSKSV